MHESRMGLKAPDETNPPYIVERSPPRRWGARLRLTGQRDTLAGRDDTAPTWLYMMGAPDDEAGSTTWPSYWGTAEGDPSRYLTELAGVAE